ALPAALRYRAAKSILTRKGKADRLPEPLPAPACIALSLLEAKETASTRFHHRTARLRQEHEAALDRLESKLFRHQQRRESAPHPERQNPLQLPITPRPNQAQADKDQNATAASTASSFPGGSR
ncbi:MAG: hypothetical protein KJZ70_04585, partial [Bryobacterales bacterium]|nr:hypothetical protein [Bryobacterales bacterium]